MKKTKTLFKQGLYLVQFSFALTLLMFFCFNQTIVAQTTDHGGADFIINADTTLGGNHINIGTFTINTGMTVSIDNSIHFLSINAQNIIVNGIINGNGKEQGNSLYA